MATPPATSYSSRPYSCSRPTKIISVRELRSRKVTTTTESPQKIDIITRGKGLQTTVNSTSTRRYMSNKIYKDASSRDESSKMKKMSNKEEKTYKKKKVSVIISSNLSKNKRKRNVIKNKEAINNPVTLRQMSLKESFAHQSVSNLRPRQNKRNYCEDSKLLQQYLPTKQQNSIVMLEKLDLRDINKVPVYKTIRTSEVHLEDNNDIYDFTYDSNDTKEKLTKKRKRNVKKVGKKIVKNVIRKKITAQSKATSGGNKSSDHGAKHPIEIQNKETEAVVPTLFLESKKENASDKTEIDIPKTTDAENTEMQIIDKVASSSDQKPTEQISKRDIKKPKIVSIENANNIAVIRSPGNSEDIQPFRPTNIFHNKNKSTLSCSLLTKSLSPIMKTCDVFDPGSPWRSPAVPMFYQTKHFIQSTPNVSKIDTVQAKLKRHVKDDSYNNDKIANISDVIFKNINPTMQNVSDRQNHKKKPNLCRKFGTEITNIGPNNSSLNQDNTEIVYDKEPLIQTETKPVSNQNVQPDASGSSNYSSFDDTDDKENAAPNYQTPKKSTKKGIKQRHLPNSSSFKTCEIKSKLQKENVEPQPGPSNLKDLDRHNKSKILHQSNLNNFLNIMDMPENTSISTKHGIFSDTQSTPINNNVVEKMNKSTIELENAFGFCEGESALDISSIENKLVSNDISKPLVQSSTRLALRELRNHLLPKKPNSNDNNEYNKNKIDNGNVEVNKSPLVQKDKQLVDVVNFSDTFDVLSESERLSNHEIDVPLFVDLEPSRFSKPPHHTYKRKRGVTFDFLEDNNEEEGEKDVRTHIKKKKFTKLEKENKRRLDEWVKTVNSTFQEIDEYDLIVE